jgi:hypothetical protein
MILLAEQWGEAIREENKNSRSPVGSLRGGGREIWSRSPGQRSSIKVLSHQIRLAREWYSWLGLGDRTWYIKTNHHF